MPFTRTRSVGAVDAPGVVGAAKPPSRRQSRGRQHSRGRAPASSPAKDPSDAAEAFNVDAAASVGRRKSVYTRTDLEETLLHDAMVDGPEIKSPTSPRRTGGSPSKSPRKGDRGGRATVSREHEFRVRQDAPASTKAAAFVTLRQRKVEHDMAKSMHRASIAFPGQLQPGLQLRRAPGDGDEDHEAELRRQQRRTQLANEKLRRQQQEQQRHSIAEPKSIAALAPAAEELFRRQWMQERGVLDGSPRSPRGQSADEHMKHQLVVMQREARTASRLVEERLLAVLQQPSTSPTQSNPTGESGSSKVPPPPVSPTGAKGNATAATMFLNTVGTTRLGSAPEAPGEEHTASAPGSRQRGTAPALPRLSTIPPSSRSENRSRSGTTPNTARPSTQQSARAYDERIALSSRAGRRVVTRSVASPVPNDTTASAPVEPTPRLVHGDSDDDAGEDPSPAAASSTAPGADGSKTVGSSGVRFRLASAGPEKPVPPHQKEPRPPASMPPPPFTPSTNFPPASRESASRSGTRSGLGSRGTTSRGAAVSSRLEQQQQQAITDLSRRQDLDHASDGVRLLSDDFATWAPTALREANEFASLGRWATLTMEQARQVTERTARAQSQRRGCVGDLIEELFEQQRTAQEELAQAAAERHERRAAAREARIAAGQTNDGLSDSDADDFGEGLPTAPIRSMPNRHLLNSTLMVIDTVMRSNPAMKDVWPEMRDELMAALFVDFERRSVPGLPVSEDDVMELVEATDSSLSVAREFWDPNAEYRGPLDQDPDGPDPKPMAPIGLKPPFTPSETLASIHACRAAFEEYRDLRAEHKRATNIMASQAKASERLARVTQMAFNRNTRRAIVGSFTAWRAYARRMRQHRRSVVVFTRHRSERTSLQSCFKEWRRITVLTKQRDAEKRCDVQRQRLVTATRSHAETVAQMNTRYDADVKALEFELFQEAETRKNTLQVHQLEQEEWRHELRLREEEVGTLKRVVRQWQRAAQLSNPVDDPAPPPEFLLCDIVPLKQTEDTLMSYFVNDIFVANAGISGFGNLMTDVVSSPMSAANLSGSFHSQGSASRPAVPHQGEDVGGRIVDVATLEYIAGGWRDSIPPPPGGSDPRKSYTDLVTSARRDLETFLCTWVNFEIRNVKLPQHQQRDGPLQISNCTHDLRDGTVYIALCRALTPKEHQRKGDLDVFATLTALMALQTSHGLLPPLLLQCPFHREFFTAEAFRPADGASAHGPTAASQHPTGGLWIIASLFVARCLKTATSSKFAVHEALTPAVRFSPAISGMPRPPPSIMVGSGPDLNAIITTAAPSRGVTSPTRAQQVSSPLAPSSGRRSVSGPTPTAGSSARDKKGAAAAGKGRNAKGKLALRSLNDGGGSFRIRRRPDSAASSRSADSGSSFDSEYDEDDEWLAQEDDDNFRIAVPDALRKLGPSELISHWMKLREYSAKWNGLARVVVALVTRHRILDAQAQPKKGAKRWQ